MASPFQKYQSEQVQQIAPGFVEAYGRAGAAIGKGLEDIGKSVVAGYEEAEAKAKEESKLKGALAPYLKRDPRLQGVKSMLGAGWMKLDDEGNAYIPDEHKDKFDPTKAFDAISFYNQVGDEGSKLKGAALTEFVTKFEAEKKYEADQASKVAAALERRKVEAEINKMNADAAEKYARAGIGQTIGSFASGADMSALPEPAPFQMPVSVAPSAPESLEAPSLLSTPSPLSVNTTLGTSNVPSGFTPERYMAGAPLATAITTASGPSATTSTTPVSPREPAATSIPVAGAKAVAPAPAYASAAMPTNKTAEMASDAYITEIPKLQAARVQVDKDFQAEMATFSANHSIGMARLMKQGATPEDIKAYEAAAKNLYDLRVQRYNTNIATLDSRLQAFEKTAEEARAAEKAAQGRAESGRAADAAGREKVKFETEYGKPGQAAGDGKKYAKFSEKIEAKVQNAGVIEGRSGGTKATELRRAAQEEHTKIMQDYPTWYQVGLTTEGGNQYQFKMMDFPTAAPIRQGNIQNVQTVVEGYAEGRVFLKNLIEAVEGGDEDRVRNYLDRFLITTSKDDLFAEGEQLGQFGVAAFRRAIVSGGNFSDADREYVQKLITQINTPNPFADKDFLKAQTLKLAKFIDAKFRSTLASNGVRLDLDTSEKFLKREDENGSNADALATLEDAKAYYRAFGIKTNQVERVSRGGETIDAETLRAQIKTAEAAGNPLLIRALKKILEEHIEAKKKAADRAAADAARARGA